MPRRRYAIPKISGALSPGTAMMAGISPYLQPRPRDEGKPLSQALTILMRQRMMEEQNKRFLMGQQLQLQKQQAMMEQQARMKEYAEKQKRMRDADQELAYLLEREPGTIRKVKAVIGAIGDRPAADFQSFIRVAIDGFTEWDKLKAEKLSPGLMTEDEEEIKSISRSDIVKMDRAYRLFKVRDTGSFQSPLSSDVDQGVMKLKLKYGKPPKAGKTGEFAKSLGYEAEQLYGLGARGVALGKSFIRGGQ